MSQKDSLKTLQDVTAAHKRRGVKRALQIGVRGENAAQVIGDLYPGCEIFGFTKGQFCIINVLEHVLNQVGPADVVICIWSAASGDIQAAHRMLSLNKIKSLKFIVDFSFKSRKPQFCEEMIDTFGGDSIRVTSCHAKFITVKSEKYNIVIRTSMNLNYNPRFENFEISDDLAMYAFMTEIVDEIWRTQQNYEGINNRPADNKRGFQKLFPCEINDAGLSDLQLADVGDLTGTYLD